MGRNLESGQPGAGNSAAVAPGMGPVGAGSPVTGGPIPDTQPAEKTVPNKRAAWWQLVLIGRNPRRTFIRLVCLAAGVFLVCKFVFLPMRIDGESMAPTYRTGGFNFVNALSYVWSSPQRGDVVAVEIAGRKVMLMKRIIALPGERVAIRGGIVIINDQPLAEPYVKQRRSWQVNEVALEADQFLVIGDNRSMAQETHRFGIATRDRLVGKVLF